MVASLEVRQFHTTVARRSITDSAMTTTLSLVPLHTLSTSTSNGIQMTTGPYILVRATLPTDTPAKRILKKPENVLSKEPEALRCKRRTDAQGLHNILPRPQPAAVARRNERERNRVKMVNMGFETLREHVPNGKKNKKMSKVDTLRAAVEYIKQLQTVLQGENMDTNCATNSSSAFNTIDFSAFSPSQSDLSHSHSADQLSPAPSMSSDAFSESFSSEEEELPDLGPWFS
ncbi:achaete-scute homolog 1b-like [Crassostrea virginica]